MRWLTSFVVTICDVIIVVALVIFAGENTHADQFRFLGGSFSGNVGWIVAGAAILGFLFAFLLLAPGRIASNWRARGLRRERERSEQELATLHGEHEQLRVEHARMVGERNQMRSALVTASAANAAQSARARQAAHIGTDDTAETALTAPTPAAADPAQATSDVRTGMNAPAPVDAGVNRAIKPSHIEPVNHQYTQETANAAPIMAESGTGVNKPVNQRTVTDQGAVAQPSSDGNAPADSTETRGDGVRGLLRWLREGTGPSSDDLGTPNSPPAPTA